MVKIVKNAKELAIPTHSLGHHLEPKRIMFRTTTWSRDVSYITNVIETSPKFIGEKRNVQV